MLELHCQCKVYEYSSGTLRILEKWERSFCVPVSRLALFTITKTGLFKYIENFTSKDRKFSDKNCEIFRISAQNLDCGYSLEPPYEAVLTSTHNLCFSAEIRKIMYTHVNPSFTI